MLLPFLEIYGLVPPMYRVPARFRIINLDTVGTQMYRVLRTVYYALTIYTNLYLK